MIEIIPKPAAKVPNWQNILLYFSFSLLLMVVLTYFILNIYLNRAEITSKDLEKTLAREKSAEEVALEEEVLGYQKKIEDFSKPINRHLFPSKFFEFVEKNTHPQIWFSRLGLNPASGEAKLLAEAKNFVALSQQLRIFRDNPLVKDLHLAKVDIGKEGKISFELNLYLDPDLFK